MSAQSTPEYQALGERVVRLARTSIAPREGLGTRDEFPWDIWEALGRAGLHGCCVPRDFGGLGQGYQGLSLAGHAMVREGHNLGLAVSWLLSQLAVRAFLIPFGTPLHHERYLPLIAGGSQLPCLAFSEPTAGAHPKHLSTTALPQVDGYVISGEKTYLTNAPLADIFLVLAVTGKAENRRRFSVFIVPKASPGLSLSPGLDLPFLKPAPHGGIVLSEVRVPAENLLGQRDQAWEDMVLPFRAVEDALMLGPLVGGMEHQLACIGQGLKAQGLEPADSLLESLGRLEALIGTLGLLAREAASMLDNPRPPSELGALLPTGRHLAGEVQALVAQILADTGIKDPSLVTMTNDLVHTGRIAERAARLRLRRMGATLLEIAGAQGQGSKPAPSKA